MELLSLQPGETIAVHNPNGCDLCNRTGNLGRALLLEALLVDTPTSKRDIIFNALIHNVNDIIHQEGVTHMPRRTALCSLVKDGALDPKIALVMIDE
jgi:general secretion pathway protein E